jgi:hypothetical protein
LIRHDLHYIYYTKDIKTKTKSKTKSKYLVLVLGYDSNSRKYNKPYMTDKIGLLTDSPKPHTRLENRERFFLETRITLNICNAMYNYYYTTIS